MKQWKMTNGRVEFDGVTQEARRGILYELHLADGFFQLLFFETAEQGWASLQVTESLGAFTTGAEARQEVEALLKGKLQRALRELEEEED